MVIDLRGGVRIREQREAGTRLPAATHMYMIACLLVSSNSMSR